MKVPLCISYDIFVGLYIGMHVISMKWETW